jgi:hypothetical protein
MKIDLYPAGPSRSKSFKLRKGDKIHFISRKETETVEKGSSDVVMGMIKTDKQEYSMDFLRRWNDSGFIEIIKK